MASVVIDPDVKAVAEFMQAKIAATRLVSVANGVAAMAPLLWGKYQAESVDSLRLEGEAISSAERIPGASNE